MSIVFQDPNSATPQLLLEELGKHFKTGDSFYCAFAFVTSRGLALLFEQEDIKTNLKRAKVNLIVGMDAITDTKAIDKLRALCLDFPDFSVQAFLPSSAGIFHPKVSLVRTGNTGIVIVGSGNLTSGGLKNNYEAFSTINIDQQTANDLEATWNKFLADNTDSLFALDSEEVTQAAKQNSKIKKAIKKIRKKVYKKRRGSDVFPDATSVVFIQDLTKGRGGKQRDVGLWPGEHYFGENKQLYLTHVNSDGKRDPEEIRMISVKRSANAALDLEASKGLDPIDDNMPISVFIRTSPNNFFYHIIPADSPDYAVVSEYLDNEAGKTPAGHARRVPNKNRPESIPVKKLQELWPSAPFWKLDKYDDGETE